MIDLYGKPIKNLVDGTEPNDAVNLKQLTELSNCLEDYDDLENIDWNSISIENVVDMVKFIYSKFSAGKVTY